MLYFRMEKAWIGTSGWIYKHWAESFYPDDWTKTQHLEFYAQHFPTVEINATFYRLPPISMVKGWVKKAPDDFIYAVKGSRYITHIKRLKAASAALKKYFTRIKYLRSRLGPILWQLPPNLQKDIPRLEKFLKILPADYQHAVEFRHPSWVDDETFSVLKKYKAAHVWLSSQRMPLDFTVTADFIYARFHGLEHGAAHDYTGEELRPWAEQLNKAAGEGKSSFVYFNNDLNTRAPLNAKMLMKMLGEFAVQPFAPEQPPSETIPRPRRFHQKMKAEPRSKRLHAAKK